jgi:hypothetical protein
MIYFKLFKIEIFYIHIQIQIQMEHWLNVLKQDENNIEALFWLANNNDKHQKEYIEKGLTIDPYNILFINLLNKIKKK